MAKISVIIPAYNEEACIAKSIEAVLAQRGVDFEVIVVNDQSTDKTQEILETYKAVKIVQGAHIGLMHACESGREVATGDIIVRMDADCIPASDWLFRGSRYFDNPRVVAVSGPYDYTDASFMFRWVSLFVQKYIYTLSNIFLRTFFKSGGVMIGGNSFIRASTFDMIGGFDTRIIFYGDDSDTVKRLSAHGKAIFDRNLIVKSSARRFYREGMLKILWNYFKGFVGGNTHTLEDIQSDKK